MTTATVTAPAPPTGASADEPLKLSWVIGDALAVAQRNLIALTRVPTTLVFMTVQPVIFVLMFRYVFGGAIRAPGGLPYVDFLMPGIFIQTVVFGSTNTGVGLAEDLSKGLIERFRSLPMARSAVLAGRTLADTARNVLVIVIMVVVGFAVGFRIHTNVFAFLAAVGVMLAFGFAMCWMMALIGLSAGTAEAAQAASFPFMALLVFASDAFVPSRSMPGWLQVYSNHQPVTATIDAVRALCNGGPTLGHVIAALAWMVGILAVFAPFAIRRYRNAA
jgi:ABC transporter DrrB family efflux protein